MAELNEFTMIEKWLCINDTSIVKSTLAEVDTYIGLNPTHTEWVAVNAFDFTKVNGTSV